MSFPSKNLPKDFLNKHVESQRKLLNKCITSQWWDLLLKNFAKDFKKLSACARCKTRRTIRHKVRAKHFLVQIDNFPAWFRDDQFPEIKWYKDDNIPKGKIYMFGKSDIEPI